VNYHEAHDTTRERAAMAGRASDDEKRQARDKAVAEREAAAREFDDAFATTPKSFYVTASSHISAAQAALASLDSLCDEKYGKVAPNFAKLRDVIEEVSEAVSSLLDKKRQQEPDELPQRETPEPTEAAAAVTDTNQATATRHAIATPQAEPRTTEEAYAIIARAAESLRKLDTASVTPYLVTRSLRWGELRSAGDPLELSLLVAPPTEVRQNLKRLFGESNWEELLSATEAAVALPCGRAWLDLHRYAWSALSERGYLASAKAICSELRALIVDFPSLPDCMLDDDTPVANPDTKAWLEEHVTPPKPEQEPEDLAKVAFAHFQPPAEPKPEANGSASPFEAALELTRAGRFSEAVEFLGRQPLPENSGRERFLRQFQTAQLCLGTGQFDIAYPILHDLFSEIEGRKLLEWETTDFVVQPLSLLVRCIDKTSQGTEQRAQVYNLLCRLQPAEALRLQNSGKV
jgi:type VI secretion system ImpA/VasJ family protein